MMSNFSIPVRKICERLDNMWYSPWLCNFIAIRLLELKDGGAIDEASIENIAANFEDMAKDLRKVFGEDRDAQKVYNS